MSYDPKSIIQSYERNAEFEDASEKGRSLRVELPREFIWRYLRASDRVLDAGGGTGISAIMMAERCSRVTLLDITPRMLQIARDNIAQAGPSGKIDLVQGDITDLSRFRNEQFTFVVCVGDAISYVLDRRFQALDELVRVAEPGSILVLGCDAKFGFMRMKLAQGGLDEALDILETSTSTCGMGPRTHLYTVDEMTTLLKERGCPVLEVASTPTFGDTMDLDGYTADADRWEKLKRLELALCTRPELLGMGLHLLFVARKEGRRAKAERDR
jgi:ubiquinone/menaquinone biosynthesis C-methylase UbiE